MAANGNSDLRKVMEDYFEAWNSGDNDRYRGFYDDDCGVHLNGLHPIAGDYVGKSEVVRYQTLMANTCTSWTLLDVEDVMVSDTRATALTRMRFEREGREPLEITRVAIYVFRNDKIVDMYGYDPDPAKVNAFFS
jgi:ketosteroid isomerase-like protein